MRNDKLENQVRFIELELNREGKLITRIGHKPVKARSAGKRTFQAYNQPPSGVSLSCSYETMFLTGNRDPLLNLLKPNNTVNAYMAIDYDAYITGRSWVFGTELLTYQITIQYYKLKK